MDWVTLATTLGTFLAMLGVMVTLFLHLSNKIDKLQVDLHADMKGMQQNMQTEIRELRRDVQGEMRDFHGRLCTIEERHRRA
jgi:hypothetical protein